MIELYKKYFDVGPLDLVILKECVIETTKMVLLACLLGFIFQQVIADMTKKSAERSEQCY